MELSRIGNLKKSFFFNGRGGALLDWRALLGYFGWGGVGHTSIIFSHKTLRGGGTIVLATCSLRSAWRQSSSASGTVPVLWHGAHGANCLLFVQRKPPHP